LQLSGNELNMSPTHPSVPPLLGTDAKTRPIDLRRRGFLGHALGIGTLAFAAGVPGASRANELRLGEMAPPLVLQTLDGRKIATRELLGQVVIVTFWATWCAPCREELPILSAYARERAPAGLQVLGFSLDDPAELQKVSSVAAGLSFPVGLLGSAWAGGYGRIWRCPVSFVIDRSGRLVDNGWDDDEPSWTLERLRTVVDPVLSRHT
jgi:peroxiredoxin